MNERVSAHRARRRRGVGVRGALVVVVAVLLAGISGSSALAVHDLGLFELDGNAVNEPAAGDDWDSLPGSSVTTTAIPIFDGDAPTDVTYFFGGGSKDVRDISAWRHSPGDVAPDKDEILDAYAAAYRTNGDLVIYFGADRFAQEGDAQLGFWFFQSSVSLNPDGTFSGVHSIGDVLVLSDFTQGGKIGTVKVFKWIGGRNPLDLVGPAPSAEVDCGLAPAGDDVCAIVNSVSETAPWAYTPKFGPAGFFPPGGFYEGGINITNLVPEAECFASFLAESRSSQSPNAELKDFVLGEFELCRPSTRLTKSASASVVTIGGSVTYTYEETNDGDAALTNASVTDDSCSPVTLVGGDANSDGVLDRGETWTFTCTRTFTEPGTFTNTAVASGFDPRLNVTVTFCTDPANPPAGVFCDQDERAQATVRVIRPGTRLTKSVSATVTYTYEETNDGDSPLSNAFVEDDRCSPVTLVGGDANSNGLLDPGETWTFRCTTTITGPPADVTNTAIAHGTAETGVDVTFCTDPTNPPAGVFCDADERAQVRIRIE